MEIKCNNCGNYISESDRFCPFCSIPCSSAASGITAASDNTAHMTLSEKIAVKRKRYAAFSTAVMALLTLALILAALSTCVGGFNLFGKNADYSRDIGYYKYNDTYYYNQGGNCYQYDQALGWVIADPSDDFLDSYSTYYEGRVVESGSGVSDFKYSDYYDPNAGIIERSENGDDNWAKNNQNNSDFGNDGDFDW